MADVLSKVLHPKACADTVDRLYRVKQTELGYLQANTRKFPSNPDYIEPNALWSPDSPDDNSLNPRSDIFLPRKRVLYGNNIH